MGQAYSYYMDQENQPASSETLKDGEEVEVSTPHYTPEELDRLETEGFVEGDLLEKIISRLPSADRVKPLESEHLSESERRYLSLASEEVESERFPDDRKDCNPDNDDSVN